MGNSQGKKLVAAVLISLLVGFGVGYWYGAVTTGEVSVVMPGGISEKLSVPEKQLKIAGTVSSLSGKSAFVVRITEDSGAFAGVTLPVNREVFVTPRTVVKGGEVMMGSKVIVETGVDVRMNTSFTATRVDVSK